MRASWLPSKVVDSEGNSCWLAELLDDDLAKEASSPCIVALESLGAGVRGEQVGQPEFSLCSRQRR